MAQEIITYLIIAGAFGFTLYQFGMQMIKIFNPKKGAKASKCGGCSADCALRELPAAKSCNTPQKARIDYSSLK